MSGPEPWRKPGNRNMTEMVLLSTSACSLCERALDLLLSMPELRGRALSVRDVAQDDVLMSAFGARVPVLCIGQATLDWPFERADVLALVRSA